MPSKGRKKEELSPKQMKAIELYLEGKKNYTEIAKEVGVARQILYEWRNSRQFNDELMRQQEMRVLENVARNSEHFAFLDQALIDVILSGKTPARDRVEAIKVGFNVMFQKQQLAASVEFRKEYEQRMKRIEDAIELESAEGPRPEDGGSGEKGSEGKGKEQSETK